MTAVLQFEVDRKRLGEFDTLGSERPMLRVKLLALMAMSDTLKNGGTFVVVAGPEKITIVQRAEAGDDI